MSNIFLSYRFTGEIFQELESQLENIRDSLHAAGHSVTCSFYYQKFFQEQRFTPEKIYAYMLQEQEQSSIFMAFVKTVDKSKGMQMESQKALELRQRYVLLLREGLFIPEYSAAAREIIRYSSFEELFERLHTFN